MSKKPGKGIAFETKKNLKKIKKKSNKKRFLSAHLQVVMNILK